MKKLNLIDPSNFISNLDFLNDESSIKRSNINDCKYKKNDFNKLKSVINNQSEKKSFPKYFDYKEPNIVKTNKLEKPLNYNQSSNGGGMSEEMQDYVGDLVELNELLNNVR